jgi:AcrR family transcriptional regulator
MAVESDPQRDAKRRPRGEKRRAALLAALEELLEERSLNEIDIAAITDRAVVTRPAFYFYFSSKSAAVVALLENLFGQLVEAGSSWYEDSEAPHVDRVRDGMHTTIAFWRANAKMILAMADAASSDRETRALWDAWREAFIQQAAARITQDQQAGIAPDDFDPEPIATGLVTMTMSLMEHDVRAIVERGAPDPRIEPAVIHLWDRALYARP